MVWEPLNHEPFRASYVGLAGLHDDGTGNHPGNSASSARMSTLSARLTVEGLGPHQFVKSGIPTDGHNPWNGRGSWDGFSGHIPCMISSLMVPKKIYIGYGPQYLKIVP